MFIKDGSFQKIFLDGCVLPEVFFLQQIRPALFLIIVVKYKCNLYNEAEGERVRSCVKGIIFSSFQTNHLNVQVSLLF